MVINTFWTIIQNLVGMVPNSQPDHAELLTILTYT